MTNARWLAGLAAGLLLVSVAVGVEWSPVMTLDQRLSEAAFAATHGHGARTEAWRTLTDWAAPEPMRWALLLAAVVALARRRTDLAIWLAALSFVEGVVAPASKHVLDRPRPAWDDPIVVLGSMSYPSGHATAAATTAVAIALVVRRLWVSVCVATLAVAVGASRVYLGAHYPTDVVAGLLLGTLLATSTYALVLLTQRTRQEAYAAS